MKTLIFTQKDFGLGTLRENNMLLDPELPLADQVDDLEEDLLWATFPNGVHLWIGWFPAHRADGEFAVGLVHNPDAGGVPSHECRCRSISELQGIVKEAVSIAVGIKGLYILAGYNELDADWVWLNELVLEADRPLEEQTASLKAELFEAAFVEGYVLTVGWIPAHDPNGRFVLSLKRTRGEWVLDPAYSDVVPRRERKPESWEPFMEKQCRSIPELKMIVKDFVRVAKGQ